MTPSERRMKGYDRGSRESKRRNIVETFMRKGIFLNRLNSHSPAVKGASPGENVGWKFPAGTTRTQHHDMSKIRQITSSPSPTTYWRLSCRQTGIIPRWTSTMALRTRTSTSTRTFPS